MRTMRRECWLVLLILASCGVEQAPVPARLDVVVVDDSKASLANVAVSVNGHAAGKTSHDGTITLHAVPPHGGHVRVAVECPDGHRAASARALTISAGQQLNLAFECRPTLRTLAVVVNAPQAEGLTVLADGEAIGRVAKDGTLHAVLKRAPESELRLLIDTATAPLLHPQNPIEDLLVPDHDDIVVFNQPLSLRTEPKRNTAHAQRPKPEEHHIPYAIGRH